MDRSSAKSEEQAILLNVMLVMSISRDIIFNRIKQLVDRASSIAFIYYRGPEDCVLK